jgi:hypothetical protein
MNGLTRKPAAEKIDSQRWPQMAQDCMGGQFSVDSKWAPLKYARLRGPSDTNPYTSLPNTVILRGSQQDGGTNSEEDLGVGMHAVSVLGYAQEV